jgi:5-methylcytosine-specific restriction endonuclease McrA
MSKVTSRKLLQLLRDQDFKCVLTGRTLTPDNCSLDHIVPIANGGEHVMGNVQLVCMEVNRAKSMMGNDEFVQLCHDVASCMNAYTPQSMGPSGR